MTPATQTGPAPSQIRISSPPGKVRPFPSKVCMVSPFPGSPNLNLVSFDLLIVKSMQRLVHLQHHEITNIHYVIGSAASRQPAGNSASTAGKGQSARPAPAGPHTGAELLVLYRDGNGILDRAARFRRGHLRQMQATAGDGRRFPGQIDHAQAIATVRGSSSMTITSSRRFSAWTRSTPNGASCPAKYGSNTQMPL